MAYVTYLLVLIKACEILNFLNNSSMNLGNKLWCLEATFDLTYNLPVYNNMLGKAIKKSLEVARGHPYMTFAKYSDF